MARLNKRTISIKIRSAKLYQTVSIPGDRSTIQINKKVILRVQYFRKYLFKIATNLNLEPEPEICPPRSGGWRVSRRRGRVFSYWRVSRRRGQVFSYLAAYMLFLVLGLVCQSAISFWVVLSGYFGTATPQVASMIKK